MKKKKKIINNLIYKSILFSAISFNSFSSENIGREKVHDQKIELKKILESVEKNYPKILALYQEIDAAEGSILAAKGFFDIKLRQTYLEKTKGYYDGRYSETSIVKRNEFLGSELYLGYRKSSHDFENHESRFYTSHEGQFKIGAKFSLLQNAMIDENRLKIINAKINAEESRLTLKNIKNEIKRDAKKAYYNWISYHEIYLINRELYDLAIKRNKQFEIRVEKGDLAPIILIENERNALSRKTAMYNALRDFENSSIYLSLFYRNENSEPIIPTDLDCPRINNINKRIRKLNIEEFDQHFIEALHNRADLKLIKLEKEIEINNLKQAKNLYKPKLDIEVLASNDLSNENPTRKQSKNEVSINFEIPLQQREAKGEIAKTNARIDRINFEEKLLKESSKARLSQFKNSINAIFEINENLQKEIMLSIKLEDAEKIKFEKGNSDFFLINIREQNTASSKVTAIHAITDYFKVFADYEAEIFFNQ